MSDTGFGRYLTDEHRAERAERTATEKAERKSGWDERRRQRAFDRQARAVAAENDALARIDQQARSQAFVDRNAHLDREARDADRKAKGKGVGFARYLPPS